VRTLQDRFAKTMIASRTRMPADLSTSFSPSRLTGNCSIVSLPRSEDAATCATWAAALVTSLATCAVPGQLFSLDLSPQMAEQARQLNPDMAQAVLHRVREADSFQPHLDQMQHRSIDDQGWPIPRPGTRRYHLDGA